MQSVFLPFLLISVFSFVEPARGQENMEKERDHSVAYACAATHLLYLYNKSADLAITQCSPPLICGQERTCIKTAGLPCASKFQYMSGAEEMPDGSVSSVCCTVSPPIQGEEFCYNIDIMNKVYEARSEPLPELTTPEVLESSKPTTHAPLPRKGLGLLSRQPITVKHTTQAASSRRIPESKPTVVPAELLLLNFIEQHPPTEFVKEISKIEKGYRMTVCSIQCRSTTSKVTTTRPTTQRPLSGPSTAPAKTQEQEPATKKGLFGRPGGHGCFSDDMTVQTPSGLKTMDQLHAGDVVQVITGESMEQFQPIEWFYHRDPSQSMVFINIKTASGQHLSLTPNHLLPLVPCTKQVITPRLMNALILSSSKFASKAKLGHCLASKVSNNTDFHADPITSINKVVKQGVYSPITAKGTIVVNGIQVSCYSSFENQAIQQKLHSFLIKINRWIQPVWKSIIAKEQPEAEDMEIPDSLVILLKLAKQLLPFHVFS